MKPLLEIKTIPISIEYKTSNARIEKVDSKAYVEVSKGRKGYQMRSLPIKFDIDTVERSRKPMPRISKNTEVSSAASPPSRGELAAYRASVQFGNGGDLLVNMELNDEAVKQLTSAGVDLASATLVPKNLSANIPSNIEFLPESASLSVRYEIDKLRFEMQNAQSEYEFIPADLEFTIKEYPGVVIKYLGGPIYVPPSTDPEYEPIDAHA